MVTSDLERLVAAPDWVIATRKRDAIVNNLLRSFKKK
jgi:hypothetical protein